ncbi:type II secretion system F family protein [Paraburkholderia sp. PREW-6R]|uniref:type II secretion system F family protein n=1 Tax=Paraburkholderia sp. PREW-6R TaxID=3141544 RepID=UPI0031F510C2
MSPVDIVTASVFVGSLLVGLIVRILIGSARSSAPALIKARLAVIAQHHGARDSIAGERAASGFRAQVSNHPAKAWLDARLDRLKIVAGPRGVVIVASAAVTMYSASVAALHYSPLPGWGTPLAALAIMVFLTVRLYQKLVAHYQLRFINAFPDTLDLIIRAVRAGVPVAQAIVAAGNEGAEPVRSEFNTMGNSLKVGIGVDEVLEVAVKRIQIPDFSFFSVCLLLQRETGGQLGETLENLSAIIRARRDLRLKTRALTGETRVASKIIAAVPFVILGILYLVSRDYVMLLFSEPSGHTILVTAAGLLATGLFVIAKMSNLDGAR